MELGWKKGVYVEVNVLGASRTSVTASGEEHKVVQGHSWLAGVRVEGSGLAYTTSPEGLVEAFERAYKAYKALGPSKLYELGPLVDRVSQRLERPPWDVDLETKVKDVLDALKEAKGKAVVAYREVYGYKLYASSDGREVLQRLSYSLHAANVTLAEGGNRGNGYWSVASRKGYTTDPRTAVREAVRKAELQLRGKGLEPGLWEVALEPPAIGVMVHEALGHMSEADHVASGSPLKKGETVGPEFLNVSDSPGPEGEWGSIFYDDEGVKPKKVEIVKEGKVNGFLTDRKHAALLGLEPTGNGRQEDPSKPPIPRMRVTYVEPGDWRRDEVLGELKRGVLIVDTSGGNAELDGTFFFMSQEAWYVEGGEPKYPLKPLGIAGNVLEMLKEVKAVGNELAFRPGTCGKWGQSVPVSVGGPLTLTALRLSPPA
ncbi:peptidase U62, modulator of DNA gyrase [Ignicoccus hospitalis KIN4/I]|uniref:Peptidase U62, modulator of DNA gyrase n=1 Tax=Ignicoccus hospitalis (strain KIN4/I / DSM 18386 / JCM 14125) TaxID=453591 RepID=A8AAY7_IGNH4|nr:peptidase U62, modulator of DNA gyrase [Ignicoccus hospitalis KIN4/I]